MQFTLGMTTTTIGVRRHNRFKMKRKHLIFIRYLCLMDITHFSALYISF